MSVIKGLIPMPDFGPLPKETHCSFTMFQLRKLRPDWKWDNVHFTASGVISDLEDEFGEKYEVEIRPKKEGE